MMSFASMLESVDAEDRLAEEPGRRARADALLLSLARVLRQLSKPGSRDAVFAQVLEDAIEITDSEYGYIAQVFRGREDDRGLRVLAARDVTGLEGRAAFFEDAVRSGLEFQDPDTPFLEPLHSGEFARWSRGDDWEARGLPDGHPPLDQAVTIPLYHAGGLVGVLTVANRSGGYDRDLVEDIEPISMTVASLIQSRTTEDALTRRQAALERMNVELQVKNDEIRRMYHTLCHELKTPLTSMREYVALVRDEVAGPLTADQTEYLEESLHACDDLTRHVNDLVDMTRVETGKLACHVSVGRVEAVLERCVAAYRRIASDRGVAMDLHVDAELPRVAMDPTRIAQVVTNLLSNATKFTGDGGSVTVEARRNLEDPAWVEVSVTDTGRGMEAAELSKIFDRLYQVSATDWSTQGGLGLGLHLSREIVRMHGGRILAESTPGVGSRFAFTLPSDDVLVVPTP